MSENNPKRYGGQENSKQADEWNSVEHVPKQVIQRKLLAALDDESKVAILASKDDLEVLIAALMLSERDRMATPSKWRHLRVGLEQLRDEAFTK